MNRTSTFLLAVWLVSTRRLRPRASKRFLPSGSGGRTLRGYALMFRPPLSARSAQPYPHTLACFPERYEESGACSGSAAWHDSSACHHKNNGSATLAKLRTPKRWDCTVITRNHEISGRATDGHLQAAGLSVRVICQSASTVPCCVHLVFQLTRSTNQCHDATLKVNSSATGLRTNAKLSLQQASDFNRFPLIIFSFIYVLRSIYIGRT